MARGILLAALGALCGCLQAPPDGGPPSGADPGGAADAGEVPPDALPADCDTAFAVAYVNQVWASSEGGELVGVLVIEALGDGVNLDFMTEGPDDSLQVELEMSQPAYQLTPPGVARGVLDPAAEALMVGGNLIDPADWDAAAPTFRLTFSQAGGAEPSHRFVAPIRVGTSVAVLEFDISYDIDDQGGASARGVTRVPSVCQE